MKTEAFKYYTCLMDIEEKHKGEFPSNAAQTDYLVDVLPTNRIKEENVHAPVFPFFAVTQQEARDYVICWLPYFKGEEWIESDDIDFQGAPAFGWLIRVNYIELKLLEWEIEDMAASDIELFFPVMCQTVYNAINVSQMPTRIISYDPEYHAN